MIEFSPKQLDFIKAPFNNTLEVLEGSPRSGKTVASHFRYAYYLINSEDENHLVCAYNQEQAYRLFIDGDGTGLMHIFDGLCSIKHNEHGDHLEVHTPKGIKRVFYKGLGKANSVGAITGMSLGSVHFCEINLLNLTAINEAFRRTFAAKNRFHMADLNPPSPFHPVIKEVFEVQDMKWTHWTMKDNPILSDQRKQELYDVLKRSKYTLERDWHGRRVLPSGIVYDMFDLDKHVLPNVVGIPYEMFFVADGGQSDATSCSCNIVVRHADKMGNNKMKLLRVANYYHSGKDTGQTKAMSTYAREIKDFIDWCVNKYQMQYQELFVDPACKSLREEFHLLGLTTRGAMNNAHDVQGASKGLEVGIERMQNSISNGQFYLVENDKYDHYHYLQEIGMYVRLDNGKPIDNYNHALDECRYANNYFYSRYVL